MDIRLGGMALAALAVRIFCRVFLFVVREAWMALFDLHHELTLKAVIK